MKLNLPVTLTATRAELGARCHRRHFLSDVLEWGLYKSPAADFGNVIHAGAGAWWKWQTQYEGVQTLPAYQAMMGAVEAEWDRLNIQSDKYTLEMAKRVMEAYSEQASLAGVFQGVGEWKPLSIEERFKVKLGDFTFSFQNDRSLAQHETQRILLVDTKTTSRPDAKWRAQWQRSLQMKLYRKAALTIYDNREVDILVEGIDKSAKPKLHYVVTPHWTDSQLDEAVEQFTRVARSDEEILRRWLLPDGSYNLTGLETDGLTKTAFNYEDCTSYGHTCPFLKLCEAQPEDRRGMLHAEYMQIEQDY